jgi:hypothetical protein
MMAAESWREFGPHPLSIMIEAMEAARLLGIRVRIGSHGVELAGGARRWIRDPQADGVDPIGAAILLKQPHAADVDDAAAAAINAPFAWAAGCSDGLEHRAPADAWVTSIKARLYSAGYQAGTWLRVQLLHNVRPACTGGKV